MSAAKSADASWRGNSQEGMGVLRCEHWLLDKALIRGLLTGTEKVTATAACKPKLLKAQMESSKSEERDQIDRPPAPREDEAASEPGTSSEVFQSDDWWRESAPESDWAQPVSNATATEIGQRKEFGTADVYFCGRKNLFPLNLAIRAIGKENLTGLLRACWDQEPIDVLARDGEILFATTRDLDLYCPETPSIIADVDSDVVANSRDQQKENGIPFLLTLARNESTDPEPAFDLMRLQAP